MSFLSRKPGRPDSRSGDAGRDDEYDSYDDYAPDGYANEDDGWSPGEYFSPEGIKGKWAGERPEGRSGGRGQRDDGRRDAGTDYDSFSDGFNSADYGRHGQGADPARAGYGADEYATGVYDLPEGSDDDRPERSRRWRRDREESGERTGIFRLRRDRGEDIWPDDGISDEDYWASVAADRPLTDAPIDNPGDARTAAAPPAAAAPPPARPGMDGRPGGDPRFGADQRGGPGRLGPAPGLSGDYQPSGAASTLNGSASANNGFGGQPGAGKPAGDGNGRTGSGPMPARPGTGPSPVRVGTGPTPTVGVTSSRPPTAPPNGMRPGPAQPSGRGSGGFPQAPARPSFQPNGFQPGSSPASSRPSDGDWGDRTERIERVNASGYPEPRPASRSQPLGAPGFSGGPGTSGGFGATGGFGAPNGAGGGLGASGAPGRGRTDNGRGDNGRGDTDRRDTDRRDSGAWRATDRRDADRREADWRDPRDNGREATGNWATPGRNGAPARPAGQEEDPLTSKAYSRAALTDTDGRSYRAAARRSQAQTKLTEQTESFITGQQPRAGQHRSGHADDYPTATFQPADQRSGEYRQYRGDAPAAPSRPFPAAQPPGGRPPAGYGGNPGQQPARGQAPSPGQGYQGQPARGNDRPGQTGSLPTSGMPAGGQPGGGLPSGSYEQQARQPQQQRPPAQPRPAQPPTAPAPASPLSAPVGSPPSSRPTTPGGLNPYDSAVTASYPYPNQSFPGRPATGSQPQDNTDDPYYRPAANGYPSAAPQSRSDQDRDEQGTPGYTGNYGNGYRSY